MEVGSELVGRGNGETQFYPFFAITKNKGKDDTADLSDFINNWQTINKQ